MRAVLNRADWVSLKVDRVDAEIWQQINRPHPDLRLADILDGIQTLARSYSGKLVSETMPASFCLSYPPHAKHTAEGAIKPLC